jgi:hypothetical protein
MNKYFEYNTGSTVIPEDSFRISPSQLSRFFDDTSWWWREQILKETPKFLQSTASELGTCVHAAAAMHFNNKQIDYSAINTYISSIINVEVDKSIITAQVRPMVSALQSQFLSSNLGTHSELFVHADVLPGIVAAGSIDLYDQQRAILYDYKSMGSLDAARVPSSFPRAYYFQQLTYAWILRKNGLPVDFCKLVYISRDNTGRVSEKTGKPLQDYPSTVNIVTHQITDEDMAIIENTLKLVAESVLLFKAHPEFRHIIMQDYRYKVKEKPVLFKE